MPPSQRGAPLRFKRLRGGVSLAGQAKSAADEGAWGCAWARGRAAIALKWEGGYGRQGASMLRLKHDMTACRSVRDSPPTTTNMSRAVPNCPELSWTVLDCPGLSWTVGSPWTRDPDREGVTWLVRA